MGSSSSTRIVRFQESNSSYRRESFYFDEKSINLSKNVLIWLEKNVKLQENIQREIKLKSLIKDLFIFQTSFNAQQKIKQIKYEKIFVIINGDDQHLEDFIFNIHRTNQIAAIYVYSQNYQSIRQLLRPIPKVRYVYSNFDFILKKLEKDLDTYEKLESITFVANLWYPPDRSSRYQLEFIKNLPQLCNTDLNNNRKKILFETYFDYYENEGKIIKEFKENFEPSTSINWFTSQPLISRLFNNTYQKGYWNLMWKYEYLIQSLFIQLKEEHQLFLDNFHRKTKINVYNGQLMNILEFKRLKMQIGKYIFITNFILANFDKDKIISYINQCEPSANEICFIIKIEINTHFKQTQPYTTIQQNNQQQLFIMLGAFFYVLDIIDNPHDKYPILLLQLYNNQQQTTNDLFPRRRSTQFLQTFY